MLRTLVVFMLVLALPVLSAGWSAAATVAPELDGLLAAGPRPVWVFFTDKGPSASEDTAYATAATRLSARALARRARLATANLWPGAAAPVTWADLPNDPGYLQALRDAGLAIRAESRWLAAVSVVCDRATLARLAAMPFVARLVPVHAADRRDLMITPAEIAPERVDRIEYGGSLAEATQVNVPAVHALGFHGEGVVIGMLDTGFNTTHEALANVHVLGAWDFVHDDAIVADQPGDPSGQQEHGTMTLSTIGGRAPGALVGPAFAASFYLAKTEDISQEVPAEEDFWVEGIEWLEAQGCDLVTSSLVYYDWYTFDDLDGDTCVITIAADMAASFGVAVFNSAGNNRWSTGTIAAPADGDSVIAVGAVDSEGHIAGFSSPGPTADGRIKPDVCARGVDNYVVVPGTLNQYTTASGTSFACPLTAGVGALLLGAHPGTSPWLLREALRTTASRAGAPDNDFGWGIVDALAALQYLEVSATPESPAMAAPVLAWRGNRPNPFNPNTALQFTLARTAPVTLDVLDVRGRLVRRLHAGTLAAGDHAILWDGRDDAGSPAATGVYLARLSGGGAQAIRKLVMVR